MAELENKIGLTFSQILSLITVAGMLVVAWISLNERITENAVRIEGLEKGRIENALKIKELSSENKGDHQLILNKLDDLIYGITRKK